MRAPAALGGGGGGSRRVVGKTSRGRSFSFCKNDHKKRIQTHKSSARRVNRQDVGGRHEPPQLLTSETFLIMRPCLNFESN